MRTSRVIKTVCIWLALSIVTIFPFKAFAGEKPIHWRFAILYPRASGFGKLYHELAENIKQMSDGRLLIQEVYDGEGVASNQILGAVGQGLVEMGNPYQAQHGGELPAGVVELGLPGGPTTYVGLQSLFYEAGWKEILEKAYATQNVRWMGAFKQPGVRLITKEPIKSLDDLARKKIRAAGAYGKMLSFLGTSTVAMNFSEVYTSLATGVIDGVDSGNMIDHRDFKWYEVCPYMYPLPITGAQMGVIIVNTDAWNQLPDDLKAILEIAMDRFGRQMATKSYIWEEEALKEMLSKGLKMSPEPSAEDAKKWADAGQKTWPEFAGKDKFCKELLRIQSEFVNKYGL